MPSSGSMTQVSCIMPSPRVTSLAERRARRSASRRATPERSSRSRVWRAHFSSRSGVKCWPSRTSVEADSVNSSTGTPSVGVPSPVRIAAACAEESSLFFSARETLLSHGASGTDSAAGCATGMSGAEGWSVSGEADCPSRIIRPASCTAIVSCWVRPPKFFAISMGVR